MKRIDAGSRFEFETFRYKCEDYGVTQNPPSEGYPGNTTWLDLYSTICRSWPWRDPAAPRQGLTRVEFSTHDFWIQVNGGAPEVSRDTRHLVITRYLGSSEASAVGFSQYQNSYGTDWWMLDAIPVQRGIGADERPIPRRRPLSSSLRHSPVQDENGLGGARVTKFLSFNSIVWGEDNFDGQPYIAEGEPKTIRQSFLDDAVESGTDLVTDYTYQAELVDARAMPAGTVTTQNGIQIGDSEYSYSTSTLNGLPTITTTATNFTSGSEFLTTTTRAYSQRIADLDLRGKPIYTVRPDGTKTSFAYERGTLSGATWSACDYPWIVDLGRSGFISWFGFRSQPGRDCR